MPIAVGIDLGTTQSAVAVYMNGEITVIPQENGKDFLPSVVSFTSKGVLVGDIAEQEAIVNPENTIFGIKRIIGRKFDDPLLQRFLEGFLCKVENVCGDPKISVKYKDKKQLYDLESISAMILKKLKVKAEIFLGHKVNSAVITVPAFFNDSQRQATKEAGSQAGLNVLQILDEPMAVAIAYELDKHPKNEKHVLIYDFGSGMFDISILKIKHSSSFETLATVGDASVGGFEIVCALVDYCADLFYKEHEINIKSYPVAIRKLRDACSKAKDVLSLKNEAVVKVDSLMGGIDFHININRSKFEELCEDIFCKTIELLHQVVFCSGIRKKDIDDVVLVGGISQIPKIRQLVSDYFDGKQVSQSLSSSLAVVYGAAVRAAVLSGYLDRRIKSLLCLHVPHSIGIETSGGIMRIIIEKGSPIPTKASCAFTTHTDNQLGVAVRIFEGENTLICKNHFLGTLELSGLPTIPRGVPKVKVAFEIDSNGILTVSAEERSSMKFDEMVIVLNLDKARLAEDDIHCMLKEAEEFEDEDKIERDRRRYRNALENYVHAICKAAFSDSQNRLTNTSMLEINKICNKALNWLKDNKSADVQAIIKKRREVIKLLQPYVNRLDQKTRWHCISIWQ